MLPSHAKIQSTAAALALAHALRVGVYDDRGHMSAKKALAFLAWLAAPTLLMTWWTDAHPASYAGIRIACVALITWLVTFGVIYVMRFRTERSRLLANDARARELHMMLARGVHLRAEAIRCAQSNDVRGQAAVQPIVIEWERHFMRLVRGEDKELQAAYERTHAIATPFRHDWAWHVQWIPGLDDCCARLAAAINELEQKDRTDGRT